MAAGDSEDSAQDGFKAFATDLLHAVDVVRERRNRSTKGCDLLLGLIQQRMVAERSYAKDLFSCSKVDFEYEEDSSLREAVESMKAHLVNKSVQHSQFADNLMQDVYQPLQKVQTSLSKRGKDLVSEVGNLQRSLKNLEEKYRKAKFKYDRAYREALAAGDEMRRAGLVPPPAAPLLGEREQGGEEKEEGEKRPVGASQGEGEGEQAGGSTAAAGGGGEVAGGEAGEAACQEEGRQGATPSPAGESEEAANGDAAAAAPNGTADGAPGGGGGGGGRGAFLGGGRSLVQRGLRAAKSKAPARLSGAVQKIGGITKKDYTGWLLPSKEQKQEEKIQAAKGLLSAAEALRLECIDLWEEYHRVENTEIHDYQCILTSFQKIEELYLAEARDGLRKQLVLEASALANQQYDVQMLFKVMDAINATSDLVSFINAARAQSLRDCFTNPESKFYNTIPLVEMDNTGPRRRPEAAAARAPAALPPPPHPAPLAWPPPPMRQDPADNAPPVDLTVTAKTAPEVLGRADLAGAWAAYLAEHPRLRPAAAAGAGGEEEGEEDAGGGAEAQALGTAEGTAEGAAEGAGDTPPPPPPPPAAPASFVADLLHTEARPFSRRAYSCTVLLWPEAAATEGGNEENGGAEEGGGGGGGRRRIFYVASDDDDDHGGGEDGEEGSSGGEEEAATRGEMVDPVAACEELLDRHPRCFVRELFPFQASAAAAEGERPREAAAFRALLEDLGAGDGGGGGGGGGGDGGGEEEGEEDRRGLRRAAEACAPVLQSSYQACALFFSMFSAKISIENQEDISSYDEQAKEALVVLLKAILDCAMQKEAYDLSNNVIAIAFQLASGEPSWEGLPPGLGAHPAWRAPATWAAALAHALGALGGGGDGGGGGGGEGSITSTLLLPPEAEALLSKKLGIRCRQVQACQVSFWSNLMVDAGIDSVQVLGLIREHTSSSLDEETQLMSDASNSPEDRGNDEDNSRHLSEFILKRCLDKLGEN